MLFESALLNLKNAQKEGGGNLNGTRGYLEIIKIFAESMRFKRFATNDDSDAIRERSSIPECGGTMLIVAALMLFLYRKNLQSVNLLFIVLAALWLSVRLLSKTSLFTKSEIDLKAPSRKRYAKLLSLLILGFVISILVSGTLFVNLSQQVGGEAGTYDSPNYRDEKFQNLIPTSISAQNSSFFSNLADYMVDDSQRSPKTVLPTKKFQLEPLVSDEISITWFGHSTLLIRSQNVTILTDPIFGEQNTDPLFFGPTPFSFEHRYALNNLPPIDYVLISHDHYDHLDMATIKDLKDSKFYVPLGVKSHLLRWGLAEENIQEFDWYEETKISDHLDIALTPAQHFSGRSLFDGDATLWGSWVINLNNQSLFFSGDSGYTEEFVEIGERYGPFDIAFLESGQYNLAWQDIHMFPAEVVQAGIDLNASIILPIHNSKYELSLHPWKEPLEKVSAEGERRNLSVATPMIGETFILGDSIPNDAWWTNVSDGTPSLLKEHFLVGMMIPPMAIVGILWMFTGRLSHTTNETKESASKLDCEE